MRPPTLSFSFGRAAVAGAAAIILSAPLLAALSRRVPDVVETPLVEDTAEVIALPIELSYRDYANRSGTHGGELQLLLGDATRLTRHRAIELLVATADTGPRLREATLQIRGTDCRFVSAPGAEYPNNGLVRLIRAGACADVAPGAGPLVFEVTFDGSGRAFVWTYRAFPPFRDDVIYAHDPSNLALGFRGALRGRYVDIVGASSYRRVDLLAYMWQVSARPRWIWIAASLAVALIALGSYLACASSARTSVPAVGIALLAGATSALYSIVVPPFQAPDEPSHFITYAEMYAPAMAADANGWQKQMHFTRLQFRRFERFRPADVTHWSTETWIALRQPDARSLTARVLYRTLHAIAGRLRMPQRFLAMRLLNAAIFAAAAALAAYLLVWAAGTPSASALVLVALSVPMAPFFAMHVSNYATLVSIYLVVSAAVCAFFLDRERSSAIGPVLGLAAGLALAASRSAAPMLALVGMVLAARAILGGRTDADARGRVRAAALFWGGYGAALLAGAGFDTARWAVLTGSSARAQPLMAFGVHALVVLAGFTFETRFSRSTANATSDGAIARVAIAGAKAVALIAVACLVASIFVDLPHLGVIDASHPPPPHVYLRDALRAGLLPFRVRDPDFLLSTTFWSAFGWVETIPSVTLVNALVTATTLSLAITAWRLRDARRALILLLLCGGAVMTLAAYAVAVARIPADLVGRYVFGLYVTFLLLSWSWIVRPAVGRRDGPPDAPLAPVPALLCLAFAAIHAYSLQFILRRYF